MTIEIHGSRAKDYIHTQAQNEIKKMTYGKHISRAYYVATNDFMVKKKANTEKRNFQQNAIICLHSITWEICDVRRVRPRQYT